MTSRGYEQDVTRDVDTKLIQLADRTARAVETIRTIVVIWAILSLFGALMILFEVTKASNGA